MEKTLKRLLSFVVAVVMVLGMVPFSGLEVFADTATTSAHPVADALKAGAATIWCEGCQKDIAASEWVPITTEHCYAGDETKNLPDYHYYIAEDISVTGSVLYTSKTAFTCVHLDGWTVESTSYFAMVWGNLNVIGDGTVTGNTTSAYYGSVFHSNYGSAIRTVRLFGGTYNCAEGSSGYVVGAANKGLSVEILSDKVTINGNIGQPLKNSPSGTTKDVNVIIKAGTINGTIIVGSSADALKDYLSIEISGGIFTGSEVINNKASGYDITGKASITGGVFNANPSAYVKTDCYSAVECAGYYTVGVSHEFANGNGACADCGKTPAEIQTAAAAVTSVSLPDNCPICGQAAEWETLASGDDCLTNARHVYLDGTYTGTTDNVIVNGGKTTCLLLIGDFVTSGSILVNGGTLNIAGSGSAMSTGSSTINAEDYGIVNFFGGTLAGGNAAQGGNLYAYRGVLKLYDGTIRDGRAEDGGNLYIANGGEATISGGTITGGNATEDGGNIYLTGASAKLEITGGIISGGKATEDGGNIAGFKNADVTMTGGTLIGYQNAEDDTDIPVKYGGNCYFHGNNTTFNMQGGTIQGSKATKSGGNIYAGVGAIVTVAGTAKILNGSAPNGGNITIANKAALNINGGTISGGKATEDGGNIHVVTGAFESTYMGDNIAKLTMTGGTVRGGTAGGNGGNINVAIAQAEISGGMIYGGTADGKGANLSANASGLKTNINASTKYQEANYTYDDYVAEFGLPKLTISGGIICGDVRVANQYTFKLSGAPQIVKSLTVVEETGEKTYDATSYGFVLDGDSYPDVSELTAGANIVVTGDVGDVLSQATNADVAGYFRSDRDIQEIVKNDESKLEIACIHSYTNGVCSNCGDTSVEKLAEAIAKGGTITLAADFTTDAVTDTATVGGNEIPYIFCVPADVTVTLDLNGNSITSTATEKAHVFYVEAGGTLILMDSAATKGWIKVGNAGGSAVRDMGGTVTLSGGVQLDSDNVTHYTVYTSGGNLTIENAVVKDGFGAVQVVGGATAVIDDGEFYRTTDGDNSEANQQNIVYVESAELTINGGNFTAETDKKGAAVVGEKQAKITIYGGCFVGPTMSIQSRASSVLKVYGGEYYGPLSITGDTGTGTLKIYVNQGTFNDESWEQYIVEDAEVVTRTSGATTFTLRSVAAAPTTTYYVGEDALTNAVSAAQDGDIITLEKDATVQSELVIDKTLTLDLNGNSLTATEDDLVIQVADGAQLVISDSVDADGVTLLAGTVSLRGENATVIGAAGMNVVTDVEGKKVAYVEGIYSIIDETAVAYNNFTGTTYDSLATALNEAQAGETVILVDDAQVDNQFVKLDVTLDLNGHVLTAQYLAADFGTSSIIDSTDGKGLLKMIGEDTLTLNDTNSYMAVKSDEGYRFYKAGLDTEYYVDYNDTDLTDGSATVYFAFDLDNLGLTNVLAQTGGQTENIQIRVGLEWTNADGESYQRDYVYAGGDGGPVQDVAANHPDKAFFLTVRGTEALKVLKITAQMILLNELGDKVIVFEDAPIIDWTAQA